MDDIDFDMSIPHDQTPFNEDNPGKDTPGRADCRCPQLNESTIRSRHGCTCVSSRGDGESESDGGGGQGCVEANCCYAWRNSLPDLTDADSDDGTCSIVDHSYSADAEIEVGDLGKASIREIFIALARHVRCNCLNHAGTLPPAHDYPFPGSRSPSSASLMADSMQAENGSAWPSMTSSISAHSLLSRSTSFSGLVAFPGTWASGFEVDPDIAGGVTLDATASQLPAWLWLTPAAPFGAEHDFAYAMEISFEDVAACEDALHGYRASDMW